MPHRGSSITLARCPNDPCREVGEEIDPAEYWRWLNDFVTNSAQVVHISRNTLGGFILSLQDDSDPEASDLAGHW
jgi:hypothetical protein